MALEFIADTSQEGTTAWADIMSAVDTGKAETVTLRATIKTGTADAYASVRSVDAAGANAGEICMQEPVKYRAPGGSPDILIQHRVNAGRKLQVQASANGVVQFTLYNRTRDVV